MEPLQAQDPNPRAPVREDAPVPMAPVPSHQPPWYQLPAVPAIPVPPVMQAILPAVLASLISMGNGHPTIPFNLGMSQGFFVPSSLNPFPLTLSSSLALASPSLALAVSPSAPGLSSPTYFCRAPSCDDDDALQRLRSSESASSSSPPCPYKPDSFWADVWDTQYSMTDPSLPEDVRAELAELKTENARCEYKSSSRLDVSLPPPSFFRPLMHLSLSLSLFLAVYSEPADLWVRGPPAEEAPRRGEGGAATRATEDGGSEPPAQEAPGPAQHV